MAKSRILIFLSSLIYALVSSGFSGFPDTWLRLNCGISEPEITSLHLHPDNDAIIFIGTNHALYRFNKEESGAVAALRLSGSDRNINAIFIPRQRPGWVLAATDSGSFLSKDEGRTWERIFQANDSRGMRCQAALMDEEYLYLGTSRGLLYKRIDEASWKKFSGVLSDNPIFFLEQDEQYLYIVTLFDVYRWEKSTSSLRQIFTVHSAEQTAVEENLNGDDEEKDETSGAIKALKISASIPGRIYLATSRGVYLSADQGASWNRFNSVGLPLEEITAMAVSRRAAGEDIIVGSRNGVFQFEGTRWISLYQGMEATRINYLAVDSEGAVYSATDKGVFLLRPEKALSAGNILAGKELNYAKARKNFAHEPSIKDVQRLAIKYAEVHPNKIEGWRKAAKYKALLPTVSVGLDRSSTDYFHWDTGGNPDVLLKGKDYLDWDLTVSWDFGDFVWSTDQTSIDSRSKLMVELREDILDQITRLYFERRRVQVELLAFADEGEPQLILDREMRLEELTALIDGYTGGRFSELAEKNKEAVKQRSSRGRRSDAGHKK